MALRGQFTFGSAPRQYDADYFNRMVGELENWSRGLEGQTDQFSTSNVTETHTFDASTASLDDVRQVLATLIDDLKKIGIVR